MFSENKIDHSYLSEKKPCNLTPTQIGVPIGSFILSGALAYTLNKNMPFYTACNNINFLNKRAIKKLVKF